MLKKIFSYIRNGIIWKYKFHIARNLYPYLYKKFRSLPIRSNVFIFQSEGDYTDNARAFYEYVIKNSTQGNKYIWLVSANKKYNSRKDTKFIVDDYPYSLKEIYYWAIAKYIFCDHGINHDFIKRKGQIVDNIWHGIGYKGDKLDKTINKNPNFTFTHCFSSFNAKFIIQCLRCKLELAKPLGYPRNDMLFLERASGRYNPFIPKNFTGKVILWMPTFRKSPSKWLSQDNVDTHTGLPLIEEESQLTQLNSFLKPHNIIIIIKVHHLQAAKEVFNETFSNIIFIKDEDIISKGLQLYQIIAKTDALLTDYSSVSTDYLLMDNPMGFILDDLEDYKHSRGGFLALPRKYLRLLTTSC